MTSRERVLGAIRREPIDRVPIHDSPWGTTEERWRREGLPEGRSSFDHFGFEMAGFGGDTTMRLERQVLEETDDYVVATDGRGATMRNWKRRTSTPELLGFFIDGRERWEEHRPLMEWDDTRVDWEGQRSAFDSARERGLFLYLSLSPGFTQIGDTVGPERLLIAMLEDPEWVRDMFMTDARLCAALAEEMMARGFDFDAGWAFDDLGYKKKIFFSTAMYRELLMPAHRMICDVFHHQGKPVILHSCGFIADFLPLFIEAGFDCIQPLEVKAGNDLLALKQAYGDRIAFMGGIDVRAMSDPDPAAIEREIATKLPAAKAGGGYLYHSDHSVPDDVSFAQYTRVMELVCGYGSY